MRRPSLFAYAIGNPLSLGVILLGGGLVIYRWWTGAIPVFPAIVALVMIVNAMQANERISHYRHWKRSWDALDGNPSPRRAQRGRAGGLRAVRILLGICLWSAMAYGLLRAYPNAPDMRLAAGMFAFATALLIFQGLYLLIQHRRQTRPRRPAKTPEAVVTLCLPVPKQSPSVPETFHALPDYCRRL